MEAEVDRLEHSGFYTDKFNSQQLIADGSFSDSSTSMSLPHARRSLWDYVRCGRVQKHQ